jgi:hypothetical protein
MIFTRLASVTIITLLGRCNKLSLSRWVFEWEGVGVLVYSHGITPDMVLTHGITSLGNF